MSHPSTRGVVVTNHGELPTGQKVQLFTLTNAKGHVVSISEYGAALVDIIVPDKAGVLADVNLGYPELKGYLRKGNPFFGCVAGRCANRIAGGKFNLDGRSFQLACNNGENHLHGGVKGFDKLVWSGRVVPGAALSVEFTLNSPDGDEGYPGALAAAITVTWGDDSQLLLAYKATTSAPTIVNLTNHSYFNLTGKHGTKVYDHVMQIFAERFTPVTDKLIPTGEKAPVKGTPMDFIQPHAIGERLQAVGGVPVGYDHNFVLGEAPSKTLTKAAIVFDPASGRRLTVLTTEPGVQFYSGNFLDGSEVGKQGAAYVQHSGFCLETQHFPDSINQPTFPSVVLRPGETFESSTVFAFDTI